MLNPFINKPLFLCVCSTSLLKILWKKEKLLANEQFLLYPQCFLPSRRTVCHFCRIWNCCLQMLSVLKSLKFVVWERVKNTDPDLFLEKCTVLYLFQMMMRRLAMNASVVERSQNCVIVDRLWRDFTELISSCEFTQLWFSSLSKTKF